MPYYEYKATDSHGNKFQDVIGAKKPQEVVRNLRGKGLEEKVIKIYYWTLVVILFFLVTGCFHKHPDIHGRHSTTKEKKVITSDDVAIIASSLANDECERIYGKRPFSAGIYSAELINTTWYWGRLDPSGVNGFSAEVSLGGDGTDPKVKIYFSTDTLQPTPIMYPENRIDMVPAENDNVLIDVIIKK